MSALYPRSEPYDSGMLEVGDSNRVYWEVCGNAAGKPAVVLHGGPGSGCTAWLRRLFDPDAYRIVLFDQRNCGRSTPHASDPDIDLGANTTHHLMADIEQLRAHLGVERWLVFGGSWGSTLALAYAERHPEHVSEIVLTGVATTTRAEIEWITRGLGRFFPEEWARFRDGVPEADRDGDLATAYSRLLLDPDPSVRERAARDWCAWEDAVVMLHADDAPNPRYDDPKFRLAFARLVTHYWRHAAWLDEGALLRDAGELEGIPGVMVHGRIDLGTPLAAAWALAAAWPDSELVVIPGAGHTAAEPATTAAAVAATDRFARAGLRRELGDAVASTRRPGPRQPHRDVP
jgi:proline iminopeptidase